MVRAQWKHIRLSPIRVDLRQSGRLVRVIGWSESIGELLTVIVVEHDGIILGVGVVLERVGTRQLGPGGSWGRVYSIRLTNDDVAALEAAVERAGVPASTPVSNLDRRTARRG